MMRRKFTKRWRYTPSRPAPRGSTHYIVGSQNPGRYRYVMGSDEALHFADGITPMDQHTSITDFISARMKEIAQDMQARQMSRREVIVPIASDAPWSEEKMPTSIGCQINNIRVAATEDRQALQLMLPDGEIGGEFDKDGLRMLGHQLGYRVDFIDTLSKGLQAEVINELIARRKDQFMQFAGAPGKISSITPGWRELCCHSEVAQVAYDTLVETTKKPVEIEAYHSDSRGMKLKLVSAVQKSVTKKRGDVLSHGIVVKHRLGHELEVGEFVRRLVCLNGMTRDNERFSWANRTSGDVRSQLDYVIASISGIKDTFDSIVNQAKVMAETKVLGGTEEALFSRAEAMGIPREYWPKIVDAWQVEEGDTEWDMLNALTRFATHTEDVPEHVREGVQASAGEWTDKFDMVNARMPRTIAERFGAQIITG